MVPLLYILFCVTAHILPANCKTISERKVFFKLREVNKIFANYVIKFNKNYNEDEYKNRLAIFKNNLEKINQLNKESNLTTFGINKFTDLTYEEMSKCYMGAINNVNRRAGDGNAIIYEPTGQVPDELDYRNDGYVTEIKDQYNCGSCYAFSAIGSIEGQYAKKHGELISLSEQQAFDCELNGQCYTGGLVLDVIKALAKQGGCMRQEDYPYEIMKMKCRTDKSKIVVKVVDGYRLIVKDEEALKDALALYGPLSIGIQTSMEFQGYENGIFHQNCVGTNHAVVLIGYGTDDGTPYWLIKNSWGTVWGEQGYVRLKRGDSLCGIGQHVFTSIVA